MVALAPVVALAGFVNWDLLAIALTSASLAAWSRRHPAVAGVWLGLAVAAKFYPLVVVGPIVLLCARRGQWRALGAFLAGAVGSWLVVNVPVMVANFEGWARFYSFSRERGMDFGSPWYALTLMGMDIPGAAINSLARDRSSWPVLGSPGWSCGRRNRPGWPSLAFLTVGAFVLTNKVYSPQYVLWVLPLAVLARPRWRDLLIWQAAESAYFVGIWWFLVGYGTQDKGLHEGWYVAATAAHWLATAWLMAHGRARRLVPTARPGAHRRLRRARATTPAAASSTRPSPRPLTIRSKSRALLEVCSESRAGLRPESWIRTGRARAQPMIASGCDGREPHVARRAARRPAGGSSPWGCAASTRACAAARGTTPDRRRAAGTGSGTDPRPPAPRNRLRPRAGGRCGPGGARSARRRARSRR